MQYVLTNEEYEELKNRPELVRQSFKAVVQDLCIQVCDNMPIKFWENKDARVWGCWKTDKAREYCDECPVTGQCPEKHKRWSK
jgi:hypothetical protein